VIANLDQLELEELEELNERLKASRIAKFGELRKAQEDKAALQVELQQMLATLADSRQFVARILRKYQTLVDKLESQKHEEDKRDFEEMRTLRHAIVELHQQMNQAKGLGRVISELEKTNTETAQVTSLHGNRPRLALGCAA
jgi:DNA repair exonuclease SbcCD ATPase subunit